MPAPGMPGANVAGKPGTSAPLRAGGVWGGGARGALAIPASEVLPVMGIFLRGLDRMKNEAGASPRLRFMCDLWVAETRGAVDRHYKVIFLFFFLLFLLVS